MRGVGRPRGPVKPETARRRKARPVLGLFPDACRTALAKKIGLHRVSITRILLGRAGCSSETLEKLAWALGVKPEELKQQLLSKTVIQHFAPGSILDGPK